MTPQRLLLIDGEGGAGRSLKDDLAMEGYTVEVEEQGRRGLERALFERWDLLVLGLDLPDMDGLQLLKRLRMEGSDLPVLIVTDRARESDTVLGLRTGADDYLARPLGILELLARVEALIRRRHRLVGVGAHADTADAYEVPGTGSVPFRPSGPAFQSHGNGNGRAAPPASMNGRRSVRFGEVDVDPGARTVQRGGRSVTLTPKEMDLLLALLARQGGAVSRSTLLEEVWDGQVPERSRTVDTHIAELRRKLEPDPPHPRHLITVRKVGYRLQP
jgi:two-component system, OmpR family, alkaline phosphatase synthesis response regulator PhoP